MAAPLSIRLVDPVHSDEPLGSASYDVSQEPKVTFDENGGIKVEHEDGSVTFDFNGGTKETENDDFYRNLADEVDSDQLSRIANELLTDIEMDIQSRKEWLETRRTGIRLLGLKLEEPRGDIGLGSAPLEGMSTIRHPLLLEATVRFQATARGELLPAAGPVKVRNDQPMRPDMPLPPPMPGMPPPEPEGSRLDDLAAALEKDFNHYLTSTATEYVPDTDRMLFYVGFGGDGFKKVYNHPLKKRPVSESVDAEDIIVSNAATDIKNCGRFTHRIKMRPSLLKRMQVAGHYRDITLPSPNPVHNVDPVEREKAEIGGYKVQPMQPKDAEYTVYECYCELDIDEFAPEQFRGKELPLPYVVTLEKDSRQVLAITRNWDEDDDQALAKQFFVQFPFIRGLGFYGLGLIHLLGNVTMALTAMWRIMIDNGMFGNFPGFLFAKGAGRQNTNQIRVPPGGGFPVDVPPTMRIQDAFMPLPYKDTGAAFTQLAAHVEEVGQRLGQTAELNIGEGKQEMPVGTTMALIEQATKIMDAVHKRLHAAQAEEFALLKERFKEDPEAFWRHNKKNYRPARQWTAEQFVNALNEHDLVPVADPNNPTSLHRIAKATIIDMLVSKYALDMDRRAALKRILRIADIDADGLLNDQPAQPPPDPRLMAVQAKAQAEQMANQIEQAKLYLQQQSQQAQFADKQQEREFKQRQQQMEMYLEQLRVQAEMIIHAKDIQRDDMQAQQDMQIKHATAVHDIASSHAQSQVDLQTKQAQAMQNIATTAASHNLDARQQEQQHTFEMARNDQLHQQKMEQGRQQHEQQMQLQKMKAEAQAKALANKPKPKAGGK